MSKKLTIRRVGTHLPTICLVGFLFLCIAVGWLSIVGLPESVLRRIEEIAAAQGVPLKISAIRLEPTQGLALKAENVRIYAAATDKHPLASFISATADISAFRLLTGQVVLSSVQLKNGDVHLPVTSESRQYLNINNIQFAARRKSSGDIKITSASLNVEQINVRLAGDIIHQEQLQPTEETASEQTQQQSEAQPINIPALLDEYSKYINKAHRIITRQNWSEKDAPHLNIQFTSSDTLKAAITGAVPRFDYDKFHFRNASADLNYSGSNITINKLSFQTVEPASQATLQGSYDWQTRHLGFNVTSNAALIPMTIKLLGRENVGVLNKFSHAPDKAPDIRLRGSIILGEDYSLHHITVNGEIDQKDLFIEDIQIDTLKIDFYYRNGNFNLNELSARFDDSNFSLAATANRGQGNARLIADLNIDKSLELVNKLLPSPIMLPEQLVPGERLSLNMSANLTTPSFEPGQTNWQDFTPSIHDLTLSLTTDKLGVDTIKLSQPHISLEVSNIVQTCDHLPTAADEITIYFSSEKLENDETSAANVQLKLNAQQAVYQNEKLEIAKLALNVGEDTKLAESIKIGNVELDNVGFHLELAKFSHTNEVTSISDLKSHLTADGMKQDELELSTLELQINALTDLNPFAENPVEIFNSLDMNASCKDITYQGRNMGHLVLNTQLSEGQNGTAEVIFNAINSENGESVENRLSTRMDWRDLSHPVFDNIRLQLSPISLKDILNHFNIRIPHIKLPASLTAEGKLLYDAAKGSPSDASFHIDIPELVRTPFYIVPFRGQEVPVSITADVHFSPATNGDNYNYTADLIVTHKTGVFDGKVTGSTAGQVLVTGANTIRTDVVDRLIDDYVAHSIMRDFRFGRTARNIITDIDVKVDYSQGISVDSFCNVELIDTEYQLSVIANDNQGNEYIRKELGPNPYTLAKSGKCYVRSKVRYGVTENGQALKDECVITIGDITMVFDNKPWFKKQDFSGVGLSEKNLSEIQKRHENTTLKGDAVIIDVENSFVELVNVRGEVYPAYSLGMFYDPIQYFMADIVLPYPAKVETKNCVFPIFADCKREMSGLIRAISDQTCGFRFLGTTIPMRRFSGFIKIANDYVLLDKLNARSWEGVLDAVVKIGFSGKHTSFDGSVTASNLNLKSILASYGTELSTALCNGHIRFRSPTPELKDIQGYGEVSVTNGDLMGVTIFQPIGALISDLPSNLMLLENEAKSEEAGNKPGYISRAFSGTGDIITQIGKDARRIPGYNHLFAYDIQNAYAKFAIANGHLRAYDMTATGYNLNVDMKLDVDLDSTYIRGNIWPEITSIPTIMLSPITFLSDFMIDILIYGKLDNIQWKIGLDRLLRSKPERSNAKNTKDKEQAPSR